MQTKTCKDERYYIILDHVEAKGLTEYHKDFGGPVYL